MMSGACCALTHTPLLSPPSVTVFPQPTPLQFQPLSYRSLPPFTHLLLRHPRLSALSNDGSGGTGGTAGNGGSGGWSSGGNESEEDGGGKWSFLSW